MRSTRIVALLLGAFLVGSLFRIVHDERHVIVSNVAAFLSSTFFVESVTVPGLQNKFAVSANDAGAPRVKILIVPGHDNENWGTEFNGLKEADLTRMVGEKLATLLGTDARFNVILSRDVNGYNPILADYFSREREQIFEFIQKKKKTMADLVRIGKVQPIEGVPHNYAPSEVALRLFGINKWANENGVDLVIHLHFNDYPRRNAGRAGEYSGFTIYVPEGQYSNSKASRAVAERIFDGLSKLYPSSNLPGETTGVVDEQELIAIGENNSLDAAGMLIEYAYIYESFLLTPALREAATDDMAFQTYLGIHRFFDSDFQMPQFKTSYLPFVWKSDLREGLRGSVSVLRLQAALATGGFYPVSGVDPHDCPLSGNFGACTKDGVMAFQKANKLRQTGIVDAPTRTVLNKLYGSAKTAKR